MSKRDIRRKQKYEMLRKAGFSSYDANKYKDLTYQKVIALIQVRKKSKTKEATIWQLKRK